MRSGIRIAQGSYIRITVNKPIPVQVDGEPWIQSPGEIIISAAGPKVLLYTFNSFITPLPGWFTLAAWQNKDNTTL